MPLTDASVVDLIDRFNVINFARLTRRDRSPELHVLGSLPLRTRANIERDGVPLAQFVGQPPDRAVHREHRLAVGRQLSAGSASCSPGIVRSGIGFPRNRRRHA